MYTYIYLHILVCKYGLLDIFEYRGKETSNISIDLRAITVINCSNEKKSVPRNFPKGIDKELMQDKYIFRTEIERKFSCVQILLIAS